MTKTTTVRTMRRVGAVCALVACAMMLQGGAAPKLAAQAADQPAIQKIPLTAGRSTVLPSDFDITRIAVTNPAVADSPCGPVSLTDSAWS